MYRTSRSHEAALRGHMLASELREQTAFLSLLI